MKSVAGHGWLVILFLLSGCTGSGDFEVKVVFPDQASMDQTHQLDLYALAPGDQAGCPALMNGSADPGDPGYRLESGTSIVLLDPHDPVLHDVGSGRRLFYAEALDDGEVLLGRGCSDVRAGSGGQVVIELHWLCQTDGDQDGYVDDTCAGGDDCDDGDYDVNPGVVEGPPGDPACSDGVDNDCDGSSDGDDPGCQACQPEEPCDDGLYCNGEDTCDATGVCSQHAGNPCDPLACREDDHGCGPYWFGLGGSEILPWSEHIRASSYNGGASASATDSYNPVLAVSQAGEPVLAWAENSLNYTSIYLLAHDPQAAGGPWVEVGTGSASGTGITPQERAWFPALALDSQDRPVVAWHSYSLESFSQEIYIKRFDGNAWVEVGAGSSMGGGVSDNPDNNDNNPALALDNADNPVVAWTDSGNCQCAVFVKRFDGFVWEDLGDLIQPEAGILPGSDASSSAALALTSNGNPVVAWGNVYGTDRTDIYVLRYNSGTVPGHWESVGTYSASDDGISQTNGWSSSPAIVLDSFDYPVVAWYDSSTGTGQVYIRRFDGNAWQEVGLGSASGGGISNASLYSAGPVLVLDEDEQPVVAWEGYLNDSGPQQIFVRRFDAVSSEWVDLGNWSSPVAGISENAGRSSEPALARGPAGELVLAWSDDTTGTSEIYIRRFDGENWIDLEPDLSPGGGISQDDGTSLASSLALGADGNPLAAWADNSAGEFNIYVRRLQGDAWVELGIGSASAGGISSNTYPSETPQVVLDQEGLPVVVWCNDGDYGRDVYAKRFNGEAWEEMGNGSASGRGIGRWAGWTGWSYAPDLALDDQGRAVVAWEQMDGARHQILVMCFNGSDWEELGTGSASTDGISATAEESLTPALSLDPDGNPLVAWQDGGPDNPEIFVKRYDGSDWVEVGAGSAAGEGISASPGAPLKPVVALDASGNPLVAWEEDYQDRARIYLLHFNGSQWVELGGASASGDGVSASDGNARRPALTMDWQGRPVLAWEDDSSGNAEIYVRRLEGNVPGGSWDEVGPGSASAGGVSNSSGASTEPSLSLAGQRTCVSWTEGGLTSREIVMRCSED